MPAMQASEGRGEGPVASLDRVAGMPSLGYQSAAPQEMARRSTKVDVLASPTRFYRFYSCNGGGQRAVVGLFGGTPETGLWGNACGKWDGSKKARLQNFGVQAAAPPPPRQDVGGPEYSPSSRQQVRPCSGAGGAQDTDSLLPRAAHPPTSRHPRRQGRTDLPSLSIWLPPRRSRRSGRPPMSSSLASGLSMSSR